MMLHFRAYFPYVPIVAGNGGLFCAKLLSYTVRYHAFPSKSNYRLIKTCNEMAELCLVIL